MKVEKSNEELEVSVNDQTASQVKLEDETWTEDFQFEEKVSANDK